MEKLDMKSMDITHDNIEKIENYIKEIEFRVSQVQMKAWLFKLKNDTAAQKGEYI